MPKTWRKGCAILLVSAMMMTGLAMLSTPAKADYRVPNVGDRFDVIYEPSFMTQDNPIPVYDKDRSDNSLYLLGEGDQATGKMVSSATCNYLYINIETLNMWQMTDVWFNVSNYNTAVFDFEDNNTADSDIPGRAAGWSPGSNGTTGLFAWRFDILKTSVLGDSTDTEIEIRIWCNNNGNALSSTFKVRIYISSIFDDPATEAHETLMTVEETVTGTEDTQFEAGDRFVEGRMNARNRDNGTDSTISNSVATLTAPTTTPAGQIEICGGNNIARVTNNTISQNWVILLWRFNIAAGTKPNIYNGTVVITYTRGNYAIDEGSRVAEFRVDFNFADTDSGSNPNEIGETYSRNQCWAEAVDIIDNGEPATTRQVGMVDLPYDTYEQSKFSDKKIKVNVTIVNNANSPLYQARFTVDMNGWRFFRDPTFFYTKLGAINYDRNELSIEQLDVGTNFTVTIELIALKEAAVGEHRLNISYTGFYYDDGSLGGSTGYNPINGGQNLSVLFSIVVTDGALDCHISAGGITMTNANYNNDITESTMTVIIWNDEAYTFIDIKVTADFTGTPFYNPLVTERTTRGRLIDAQQNPITTDWTYMSTLNGNGTGISFIVDIDPSAIPDRYRFSFNVTAIIKDTLVTVSTIVFAEFSTIGYGPRISIEAFTAGDITPGQDFPLTLTLRNDGDETLRDGFVFIGTDTINDNYPDYYQDWDAICNFIGQIQRENETSAGESFEWDGAEVTLQQLDIDSAKEIIELNLYMDGVYADPSAVITLVRIREPLAPGQTVEVSFTMRTDKDMVKGKPYTIDVRVYGKREDGNNSNVGFYNLTDSTLQITVRTKENGQSYQGIEWNWFDDGMKLLGLFLFLVIIIVIVLIAFKRLVSKKHEEHVHEPPVDNPPPQ